MNFSGSYQPEDVTFLLRQIQMEPTPVDQKEALIQSGARHYSQMISAELVPSEKYMRLFNTAMATNGRRFATDVARLAAHLAHLPGSEVVLVSLARAGTPVGVLLRRALSLLGVPCVHYSISIIRDRGIDVAALDWILSRHSANNVTFIDGWTGKGAIATELSSSIARYNASRGVKLAPGMTVVADLAGVAELAATSDDYLIPSSILNAVISGLISRSIIDQGSNDAQFHACVYFDDLVGSDISRWFVDEVERDMASILKNPQQLEPITWTTSRRRELHATSQAFLEQMQMLYGFGDRNRLKPGIGEATRALLRRVPERIILQDPCSPDTAHLIYLAQERNVIIEQNAKMPYGAAAIIQTLGNN